MKKVNRNKIINIFLILAMLSHVTYLHDMLDNYVLCYGTDGHVAIENINDTAECVNPSSKNNELQNELSFSNNYENNKCNDISLHSNCFADNQFLLDKKNITSINLNCFIQQLPRLHQKEIFSNILNSPEVLNQTLHNYSTVSLLI
ncbi:MAG: hypothetical protein KDC52_10675 [Ignavibacteriae bacterium]|nr:hypothetical protein [Ignavibacteriota bacterium]